MGEVYDFDAERRRERAEPIRFKLRGRILEASPTPPLGLLRDYATMTAAVTGDTGGTDQVVELVDAFGKLLERLLYPESLVAMWEIIDDPKDPLGFDELTAVVEWITEQYGARPTSPSSPSSNGHGGSGVSSTEPAPPQASTRGNSPSSDY